MAWVCCQKIKHYLPCWPNNKGTLIHHHFVLFGHQGCRWHFGHMIKDSCIWIFILFFEWIIAEVSIAANDAFCHIYLQYIQLNDFRASQQQCLPCKVVAQFVWSVSESGPFTVRCFAFMSCRLTFGGQLDSLPSSIWYSLSCMTERHCDGLWQLC